MIRSFTFKAMTAATLSMVAMTTAGAQTSVLSIGGNVAASNQPGSGGAQLLLDFISGVTPTPGTAGAVTANAFASGAFSGVAAGTAGSLKDLVFSQTGLVGSNQDVSASHSTVTPAPVTSALTIGGFTFTFANSPLATGSGLNFGPISLMGSGPNDTGAQFAVNGTVTGGAFGTMGQAFTGIFTAQFAGQSPSDVFNSINSGGTQSTTFSASFFSVPAVTTTPEPATYALLATGLGALGLVARRRRQA